MSHRKPELAAFTVTLVGDNITSKPGQLGEPDIGQVHRKLTDSLGRARVKTSVTVAEVSMIEHESKRYPRQWLWHQHGFVFTRNPVALALRLEKQFPKSDLVPRPIRIVLWDGDEKWPRYCYKLPTRSRVGIDGVLRFDKKKQRYRQTRGTKSRSLKPEEFLELLLYFDRISLDSRIITRGSQLRASKSGCKIVLLRRPKRTSK